ncbi:MAG: hypothetical protein EA351_03520, partial [Gemmatimonadales bacterium]
MTATGRFRYRDESGEEHELASIEALSQRVEEGSLSPDTSLFDAGTGRWGRAGDLPVFQFIVDELRREGRLPEGFDALEPVPPPREAGTESPPEAPSESSAEKDLGPDSETLELEDEDTPIGPDLEELPLTPDPFEMHLPRSMQGAGGEEEDDEDEEVAATGEGLDSSPLHEWMLSQAPRPDRDPSEETPPPTPPPLEDRPRKQLKGIEPLASKASGYESTGPAPSLERDVEEADDVSEWDTRVLDKDAAPPGEIRSRPPPPRRDGRSRSRHRLKDRRKGMIVGVAAAGAVILLIAVFMLTPGGEDPSDPFRATGPEVASGVSDPVPGLPAFPLPDGSPGWAGEEGEDPESAEELAAAQLQAAVSAELESLLDSVRVERDLDVVPPGGWLGGRYLSGASGFDEVPAFWEGYTAFIEQLMEVDEDLYLEAARRGWERVRADDAEEAGDPGDLDAFMAVMGERYAF